MRMRVPIAVVAFLAAGCSRSLNVELPAQPLTVVQYSQGKASQRCVVSPRSEKFRKLADFLKQSADDWHKRSGDYVPSLVVIGADLNMYFMEDLLVLTYNGGEYSRKVTADSYAFLNCAAH